MQTSRWPISKLPIAHLEPFPYHKGELYVDLLDRLAKYVTDQLHPNLRETVEHMVEELEHILALQHGKYVEGIQDFQSIHDAFMTDVNSALMALNDNAVSDLADDPGTAFGQKLRELFATTMTDHINDDDSQVRQALDQRYVTPHDGMVYATKFGVVGDTGEDMTARLQAAIDASDGVELMLPPGEILVNNVTTGGTRLRLVGSGRDSTRLVSRTPGGPVITLNNDPQIRSLSMESYNGGNVVEQDRFISTAVLTDFRLIQSHPDYSAWDNKGHNMIECRFTNFLSQHVNTATVPTWNLVADWGVINANKWSDFRALYSGNYHFHLECTGQNRLYGNIFEQANFEVCPGGLIKLVSVLGYSLHRIWNWDLVVGTPEKGFRDAIAIENNQHNQQSIGEIDHYIRIAGQLEDDIYDISYPVGGFGSSLRNVWGTSSAFMIKVDQAYHGMIVENARYTEISRAQNAEEHHRNVGDY